MADAQNERTNTGGRRRDRKGQRGKPERGRVAEYSAASDVTSGELSPGVPYEPAALPAHEIPDFVRPLEIAAPTDRIDVYCVSHTALVPEQEPFNVRTNMTTLRHLAVNRFGEATLYCDCLHNGPHEWPPSLQRLETAIELDQFVTDSTSEA